MNSFKFHTPTDSSVQGRAILNQVQDSYGFVPNLFAYMAEAPVTVEAYLSLTQLLDKLSLTPQQSQIVLLAISQENGCGFCIAAHHAIGKRKGVPEQTASEMIAGREISDLKTRALVRFAHQMVEKRGWLDEQDLSDFFAAGFEQKHVFEIILIAAIKTLSNYSNHLTRPEINPELMAMLKPGK
ncbi:carboxymuconolactone decarboxylase family protein [Vibrio quintilis]|uniref:Carboxymuconolactone decarboxylase family protein n=1 Tax=Vibrio quintilis TaxID=1117707 RepID=A0A1M7Z1D0_9VIBR|nr:carboxymuconolactone decarboxylase family protein [Vibrio quintilis]SHO58759.1 Carboxymuconolactone decarboxylase family protein [Vibrio quintilis]